MKIVIDARLYSAAGLGRYIRNLINNLQKIDQDNDYYILLLKKEFDQISGLAKNFNKVQADFNWYGLKEQVKLPKLLKSLKPDLVHFPHFNVPIFYQGKFIVTIHDLVHQHFQLKSATAHNPFAYQVKKWGYNKAFTQAVTKSLKIITPSNFVKDQLVDEWGINKNKIVVTLEGVEENFLHLVNNKNNDFKNLSQKLKIKQPYLFYVGNAHPHKNVPKLIEAFHKISLKHPEVILVMAGPESIFWQRIKESTTSPKIFFLGFISDEQLTALYKNAEGYVFPSLEEGFGIPLLEAMACGCPVVSSNAASLPEIGGDACIYFNPKDVDDIAAKITQVLDNKKLRIQLIEKGQRRYKEFSWKRMAEQTLEIYREVLRD